MELDDQAREAARGKEVADRAREFHALKAREAELTAKVHQVTLDRINLEKELAKVRTSLAKHGGDDGR